MVMHSYHNRQSAVSVTPISSSSHRVSRWGYMRRGLNRC